jgi:hypothetical protein
MNFEIKEYIGSKIPKNYSNFEADNFKEIKNIKTLWHFGRNYYKLGTATQSLKLLDRIWLGISAIFQAIITLNWSHNKNDLYLAWKGGERNVTLYTNSGLLYFKKRALQIDANPDPGHEGVGHYSLAVHCRLGIRVEKSLEKAIKYLKKSAEMNCLYANNDLGEIYHKKNSIEEAIKFYEIAAEQGVLDAQLKLGKIYSNGQHYSFEKALHNFKKAESQGSKVVHYYLGRLYRFHLSTPSLLDNWQEVEKLARESIKHFELVISPDTRYVPRCVYETTYFRHRKHKVRALRELGEIYDRIMVERLKIDPLTNNGKAAEYYRRSIGKYRLKALLKEGLKVDKSEEKALEYLKRAAT